jgi:hypothetical protein
METKTCAVKSQRKVVGQATYPQFDTVEEAISELTSDEILKLVNAQVKTNEMNRIRASVTGTVSKTQLREMAIARVTPDEFASAHGDREKMHSLLLAKEAEIKAELAQAREEAGVEDDDDVEAE